MKELFILSDFRYFIYVCVVFILEISLILTERKDIFMPQEDVSFRFYMTLTCQMMSNMLKVVLK